MRPDKQVALLDESISSTTKSIALTERCCLEPYAEPKPRRYLPQGMEALVSVVRMVVGTVPTSGFQDLNVSWGDVS